MCLILIWRWGSIQFCVGEEKAEVIFMHRRRKFGVVSFVGVMCKLGVVSANVWSSSLFSKRASRNNPAWKVFGRMIGEHWDRCFHKAWFLNIRGTGRAISGGFGVSACLWVMEEDLEPCTSQFLLPLTLLIRRYSTILEVSNQGGDFFLWVQDSFARFSSKTLICSLWEWLTTKFTIKMRSYQAKNLLLKLRGSRLCTRTGIWKHSTRHLSVRGGYSGT